MKQKIFLIILALLILLPSCKSPSSTDTDDGVTTEDYSGSWSGTTTQGESISFTIVNNAFTQFQFSWRVSITGCNVLGTVPLTYEPPLAFSGNTFTISGTVTNLSYSFSGTFNSSTTASGNGSVTYTGGCPGSASFTWSANRN